MKKAKLLYLFFISIAVQAQQAYYKGVDFSLPPEQLYQVLQKKLEVHNTSYTYGSARDMMKITDAWKKDKSKLVLIYGFEDKDQDCTTDYTRNKNSFGAQTCQYNREHVFAKSIANPPMGQSNNNTIGIAADPHNIRAADQRANQIRANKKFGPGTGNAKVIGQHWYPGDEWKGDVARMMMYMYLRYGERCMPNLVGVGKNQDATSMLELFLNWNAEDPVSYLEIQRNEYLQKVYGNRNPFIDNPYLAHLLWGGVSPEDTWNLQKNNTPNWEENIQLSPLSKENAVWIESKTSLNNFHLTLYNLSGKEVLQKTSNNTNQYKLEFTDLPPGVYFLNIQSGKNQLNKQIILK